MILGNGCRDGSSRETEGMIMAAQDQVLRTRYIFGTNISPICRIFNKKDETINHITSECPALAPKPE